MFQSCKDDPAAAAYYFNALKDCLEYEEFAFCADSEWLMCGLNYFRDSDKTREPSLEAISQVIKPNMLL